MNEIPKPRKKRKSHKVSAAGRRRMSAASYKKWRESAVMGSPAYCAKMRSSLLNSEAHAAAMVALSVSGAASERVKKAWATRRRKARAAKRAAKRAK